MGQAKDIIYFLKTKIADYKNANIIIGGDFNAKPDEPLYSFFESEGF